jgi:hypothetical protein
MPAEFTHDGRYLNVRGRLWRTLNPALEPVRRQQWVDALIQARRTVQRALRAGDEAALREARAQIDEAKVAWGRTRASVVD